MAAAAPNLDDTQLALAVGLDAGVAAQGRDFDAVPFGSRQDGLAWLGRQTAAVDHHAQAGFTDSGVVQTHAGLLRIGKSPGQPRVRTDAIQ
jgi:hypothetical protein